MATNHKKEEEGSTGATVGKAIVGLAALAAAAAGTYFLYGSKNAAKNRKAVKGWVIKMKGEVLERMEELKDVSEEVYYKVIDEVKEKYEKMSTVSKDDLNAVTAEMKSHWKDIKKDLEPTKKAVKKIKKIVAEIGE